MKTIANYSAFEQISLSMAKTFGTIKKGHEEDYAILMMPIEGNLLKTSRKTGNNNGRRVTEAIKICLFTINGYLNGWEYDFSKYLSSDNHDFVQAILMAVDPFTNGELRGLLGRDYDFESTDDLHKYFTIPIKCILRIEASVEMWTKENGVSGYFDFLEDNIGQLVPEDDKMDYIIELPQ